MVNRDKKEASLTIAEAVETLSSIAEMDIDRDVANASRYEMAIPDDKVSGRAVEWLQEHDMETTIDMVKEIFHVILNHLRSYYKKEYRYMANPQTTEGIKAIMVLVGEAGKKLDKYAALFHKNSSVTQLKEYKRLQDFYLTRIAHRIDESVLSKWIMGLSTRVFQQHRETFAAEEKIIQAKHVFVDFDAVRKDLAYELFSIRKEDGTRFFSPKLIRNIKLVCDFGSRLSDMDNADPLESLKSWRDRLIHRSAKDILRYATPYLTQFYQQEPTSREGELQMLIGKIVMALKLCSNPHHLYHDPAVKSCSDYFADFQKFLRQALNTRDYQRLIAYPNQNQSAADRSILELLHAFCYAFFTQMKGTEELTSSVQKLLEEAYEKKEKPFPNGNLGSHSVIEQLFTDNTILSKFLKQHANGPLINVLETLEADSYHSFDPLFQNNIPSQLFTLELEDRHVLNVRIPSPTHQELINKVNVIEEFKAFLRSLHSEEKHLLINLQDRTSWREHSRCAILEDLQNHEDFKSKLVVVTLPKDTEFYHQEAPYNQDNHAETFIKAFKEQMMDSSCGFFFPEDIQKELFPKTIDGLLNGIHQFFFGGRNIIPKERRLDFIEIFYLFLELKLIDLIKPSSLSFTCKDCIDAAPVESAKQYIFLKLLKEEKLSNKDLEKLNLILHAPALIVRERLMQTDSFHRFHNAMKEIELARNDMGCEKFKSLIIKVFGKHYKSLIGTQ